MSLRRELVKSLISLKENNGAIAVKAEFEAEGSRKDELIMLQEFVEEAGLDFIIKIGGCEAVHDLDQCKLLNATGVMAPMIETPFAMKKFKGACQKIYGESGIKERIINAETKTCLRNFDEILEEGKGFITGVTVGRSDLSASMGIARKDIESKPVFEATKEFLKKSSKYHIIRNFGGNIGINSVHFIIDLYDYIDRFETRKIVLKKNNDENSIKRAIREALNFELLYLNFKSDYYSSMAKEDEARINRMKSQIELLDENI